MLTHIPLIFYSPENVIYFLRQLHIFKSLSAYIQVLIRVDFFMEANNMDPDQTAPKEQSDLGPYFLQDKQLRRADDKNCDWWAKR